mmetsp:Transcript_37024/g.86785  ORF Transcript_37024/g.86785 Transcript_37024/m.86785 type:complete len:204 (-) Transcript_37024:442-1053(-)
MFVAMAARLATCFKITWSMSPLPILSPKVSFSNFVATSVVTSLFSAPSADFKSVFMAFSATLRASGSEIFSQADLTRGSSRGITGSTAAGSSTTLHMLSTIWQHVLFTSSDLSFKPRDNTGNITAKAGVSTFCTKMQPARVSTHLWVLSMEEAASMTAGKKGSKSLFPVQLEMAPMHVNAAAFTSFLMSQVRSATGVTNVVSS